MSNIGDAPSAQAGMFKQGPIRHPEMRRTNSAMIVAMLLPFIGLAAILRVALSAGPL